MSGARSSPSLRDLSPSRAKTRRSASADAVIVDTCVGIILAILWCPFRMRSVSGPQEPIDLVGGILPPLPSSTVCHLDRPSLPVVEIEERRLVAQFVEPTYGARRG